MALGASIRLTREVSGLRRKLEAAKLAFRPQPLLKLIGLEALAWIDANFEAEGKERKWRPLSPRTIARRRLGSSRILQDTGRLRQSFVPGQTGSQYRLTDRSVTVGTNVIYAATHHYGRGAIPSRPLLPSQAEFRKLARASLQAYVDAKVSGRA